MLCELCGSPLEVCKINESYHICTVCKTQVLVNTESCETDFYANLYLIEDDKEISTFLRNNNNHYQRFFDSLKDDNSYKEIINDIINSKLDTCHCYGGGFPMLESRLPFNNINIYDLIANKYESHIDLYRNIFKVDKNIKYNIHDLKDGFIKTDTPTVFSFIHILEHFPLKDLFKTLKEVEEKLEVGSYVFIYQPNPNKAHHKNWTHYNIQHITLITTQQMVSLINSYKTFKVLYNKEYSDDMFIIFKKI
jgi:hypothetical protein